MSSIPSILVRSTMSTIKKELEQLEQWLSRDWTEKTDAAVPVASLTPTASLTPVAPVHIASPNQLSDATGIYHAIQQLSKQLEVQQHTLNHIIDRMDVLEDTKEVHISSNDPWLDSAGTLLQNELDEEHLDEYEPIINVHKAEEPVSVEKVEVAEPVAVVEPVAEPVAAVEPVAEPVAAVEPVAEPVAAVEPVAEPVAAVEPVAEPVAAVEPVAEPVAAVEPVAAIEEVQSVEVAEPVVAVKEVKEVQEEVEEEEEEEEVAEEEEEEDDMEYEEIEYNGTTYYRDTDKFVYTMNKDGELSEHPIGYWKEKSKAITFYKK
jgi:hypothetical protein